MRSFEVQSHFDGKEDMVKYTGQACSRRNVLLGEMIVYLYALKILQYFLISYVYERMCFLTDGMLRYFIVFLQAQCVCDTMPKKGKNKSKVWDDKSKVEITLRVEIIYEDTKFVTKAKPEFKWG